jgi:hypothetical protein
LVEKQDPVDLRDQRLDKVHLMRHSLTALVTLVTLSFFTLSCGSNQPTILQDIKVETTTVNDEVMLSLTADVNLGAMTFPNVALPIRHPRGQTPIGQVELVSVLGGKNQIRISVNASALADVQASRALLPNGNAIPLIASNNTVEVNLGGRARLYLTLGANATAIGVAVPLAPFDSIGQNIPGLNFFPVVTLGKVIAAAGVFTGAPGQNGIALIADITQVLRKESLVPVAPAAKAMDIMAFRAEPEVELDYSSHVQSKADKARLDGMLLQMHQRKVRLNLHR